MIFLQLLLHSGGLNIQVSFRQKLAVCLKDAILLT